MASDQPIYNIGAVERMTGISSATLRAWERRYGFPEAARTEGGHRLYSEVDVLALQWVKHRIDQGMQTGQAIRAFQNLESADRIFETENLAVPDMFLGPGLLQHTEDLKLLQECLLRLLMAHDLTGAERLFQEDLTLYSPESLIYHVIIPTLSDVGRAWAEGHIDVSTEHMASQYLHDRLIMWKQTAPPSYAVPPTILACAPGEWHEGSLLIFETLLRRRRWPVVYLGQSVPLEDLAHFIKEVDPLVVLLVAMRLDTAQALIDLPSVIPELSDRARPLLAFGGRIFVEQPALRESFPGAYLGDTIPEGVENLEMYLRRLAAPLLSRE